MENDAIKSSEHAESAEQLKVKYESIPPMDMWPTKEAIGKVRLDEIFDTFNENSTTELPTEDKKEIENLIAQFTEWRANRNDNFLDITRFIKDMWEGITKGIWQTK
jgi:hypothetical protein